MKKNNFENENSTADEKGLDENFWEGVLLPEPKKKVSFLAKVGRFILCVAIFVSGFAIAMISARGNGWFANLVSGGKHTEFTLPTQDKPETDSKSKDSDGRYTPEGLAKEMSPSVVVIEVYSADDKLLPSGQGSGVIISENGYIVTNAHVIQGGKKIKVQLNDFTLYNAKVVGSKSDCDLAVIKIEATDLKPATFGKSSQATLGEEVMTIGTPGGYSGTVTKGIISGLNRRIRFETGSLYDCIQIDAAINPGNSGGALFNMWGQVIGITSSKMTSEKYDGIGFAISSDYAKPVIENLISGKVEPPKARIGITYYKIDEKSAKESGVVAGLMVESIDKDYPVAKTDLKEGDIITEIDGKSVFDIDNVGKYIQEKGEGKYIVCKIVRYDYESDSKKSSEKEIKIKIIMDNSIIEK